MSDSLLVTLAKLRQATAGDRYVIKDGPNAGHNMAEYRDNTYDILEELADAWNITKLLRARLIVQSTYSDGYAQTQIENVLDLIELTASHVLLLREMCKYTNEDKIEVERSVTWDQLMQAMKGE